MGDTADFDRTDRPDTAQPPPVHVPGAPSAHDLVITDMEQRKAYGLRKYGTVLQADNGRDHLRDAYEEVLDLAVYLRCAIAMQDAVRDRQAYPATHVPPNSVHTITQTFTE